MIANFFVFGADNGLGVGLWLSAMNVQFRDVRYVVPFMIRFWLLATPVAYLSSLLSGPWRTLYDINPMTGVVEGFRLALLGADTVPGAIIIVSSPVAAMLLINGAFNSDVWRKRLQTLCR